MLSLLLLPALWGCAALAAPQASEPLRIFLRAGPATHGEGEHDHPRFLEEWSSFLTRRGALVEGALGFPVEQALERTDVLVMYAADAGSMTPGERRAFEAFLGRGGGVVVLHDAVVSDSPDWYKNQIGGAWVEGKSEWRIGTEGLYFSENESPITRGVSNFDLEDEIYFGLDMHPDARVLAHAFPTTFLVEPQMWTFEPGAGRVFVSLQGHFSETFAHPAWRTLLLRGIAWAGRREVELLTSAQELNSLRYPPGGPKTPEQAAKFFELAPGFQLSLAAAEPLIQNPISIDWDAQGRMWVACTPGYPYKQEFTGVPAHDEIVVLEDRDGDGLMDQRQVFAGELDLVTSLVLFRDGVIVSQAPDILFLRDRDGDGKADTREVLYTGFGYQDTHAVISNLRWGRDGWIYGTQGYSAAGSRQVRNAAGKNFGAIGNGVFRLRPDGSAIEVVSSYGSNTWGLDFDRDGELLFTMANASHLRLVVLSEMDLGSRRVGSVNSWAHLPDHHEVRPLVHHLRSVYEQIDVIGGFTAAAGCLVYGGGAWPDEYEGDHFVCEPTVSLVHRDKLAGAGVSMRASKPREAEFLASSDLWFRPVHLRSGPDGALFVLDFYNQAAVHNDTRGPEHGPTNAALRPDRDSLHGRIWRVQHSEAREVAGALTETDMAALVEALSSPNRWRSDSAGRLLRERPATLAGGELAGLLHSLNESNSSAQGRSRALWLLQASSATEAQLEEALRRGLADGDPGLRRNAARVAALAGLTGPLQGDLLRLASEDADARARLLAMLALGQGTLAQESARALARAYDALEDDWSRTVCLAALRQGGVESLDIALEAGALDLARGLAADLAGESNAEDLEAFLEAVESAPVQVRGPLLYAFVEALPADVHAAASAQALISVGRLLETGSAEVVLAALALAERLGAGEALAASTERVAAGLMERLDDPETSFDGALDCLAALVGLDVTRAEALARAAEFLEPSVRLDVQRRAIALVAGVAELEAGVILARALPSMGAAARAQTLAALLSRGPWAAALLDEVAAGWVLTSDLGPRGVHALKHHASSIVAIRANELLGGAVSSDLQAVVERLAPEVASGGDALRGAALFAEHCGTCHTFEGQGADIGPVLTGMGAHGRETLLALILDPNREVEPAYIEFVVECYDGTLVTGLLARETDQALVLKNTEGQIEIPREHIESMRSSGLSLMPTGLESLGVDILRDILAHLTGSFSGYRVLDLAAVCNANTKRGMHDPTKAPAGYRFVRTGILDVDGVPFELLDPETAASGSNALALRGGPDSSWLSKSSYPQRVRVDLKGPVGAVHVLGGVAGWGFPWGESRGGEPLLRWTFVYMDGEREEHLLHNGVEFADWIGPYDVPGSRRLEGIVAPDSYGQVRTFSIAPLHRKPLAALVLESYDNFASPIFLALSVESAEHADAQAAARASRGAAEVLIFGGGSSHDFGRWFQAEDLATLQQGQPDLDARYSDDPEALEELLGAETVLVLCTNQPLDEQARGRIESHARGGCGLFALHPGTWRNWAGWTAFPGELLGGGATGHEPLAEFDVRWTAAGKAWFLPEGDPVDFALRDELYQVELDSGEGAVEILAEGFSRTTGARFPVLWTATATGRRVLACTLGHDGDAHQLSAYRAILRRGCSWLRR